MRWSVVNRTARPNGGRARESRRWLAVHHPSGTKILASSVPPTTRQKKKRKPRSACGSNGAPTRVPLGGPRNGERHVLSLAPTAKRTARLHHSTSRLSRWPPPREGNVWTPPILGTWFPCRSLLGPTQLRQHQQRVVVVRLNFPTRTL